MALQYDGQLQFRRVVARAGDVVDFQDGNLLVNGAMQFGDIGEGKTFRYDTGVEFPLTVGENQVFVLGDNRVDATDSRVYGAVDIDQTLGKVMTIIRRRDF